MPFSVKLTPEQYSCAIGKLGNMKNVDISVGKDNPNYGIIKTNYVQAEFVYKPEESLLTFQNEHLHGLAKFASETTIESHLNEFIAGLNCPPVSTPSQPAPVNGGGFTPNVAA